MSLVCAGCSGLPHLKLTFVQLKMHVLFIQRGLKDCSSPKLPAETLTLKVKVLVGGVLLGHEDGAPVMGLAAC